MQDHNCKLSLFQTASFVDKDQGWSPGSIAAQGTSSDRGSADDWDFRYKSAKEFGRCNFCLLFDERESVQAGGAQYLSFLDQNHTLFVRVETGEGYIG